MTNDKSTTTNNQSLERISLLLALTCLSMSAGFLTGRLAITQNTPITFTDDRRPIIPTITIEGVRNGLLHGTIKGNARVIIGNELFTQSGVFAMDAGPLLVNEISIIVPSYAQFVASNRGKKYYPVFSSAGENISPRNRIYFSSEKEAIDAGYSPSH